MATRDLTQSLNQSLAFDLQLVSTDTTTVGNTIDTQGYQGAMFTVATGVVTDGDYEVQLFAGDAANMSDEAEVTTSAQGLRGTIVDWAADTDDDKIQQFGYGGDKRYLRLKVVSTTTTSGATLCGVASLGHADRAPATQADGT